MNRNRKLSRVSKTIVSGLVVTSLVLGNGAFVQAEKVMKDESVYVNADADGTAAQITVSDWLKNAGVNGVLEDKSTLTDIQNVKGDETFEKNGEGVSWSAGGEDIYYQGKTDKKLPVSVHISYELDGKEITAEELAGKSGKVKITVSYQNHSKVRKTIEGEKTELYTPFLMATGVILPTDKFTNVEVDDARMINEGSNQIVMGFGVPGMAESLDVSGDVAEKFRDRFTITADVKDFSLGNTITYASASILSDLEVEDDETFDDLEESIEQLVDSSEELLDGTDTISEKMGELEEKFDDFANGEKDLNQGIQTLSSSGKKLVKGVKDYVNGVDTLAKGTRDYVNGAAQITSGNKSLHQAVKDMPASYQTFSEGLKQYTTGVDQLGNKTTGEALTKGAAAVSAGITTVNENLQTLQDSYDNYDAIIAGLKAQAAAIQDETQKKTLLATADSLKQLSDTQKLSVGALVTATDAKSDLKSGASQVSGGVKQMVDGAQTLASKSQSLRDADGKLTTSIATLAANVKKLSEGSETLSKNDKKLLAGAKKLLKAGKTVKTGSNKLVQGADKLKKGSNKLDKATGKVFSGIKKLGDGADDLKEGMERFDREGIQEINKRYEDDFIGLKDRLEALLDISREYTNFSGIGDGMDGEVKFIIETKEIKSDSEK